MLFEMARYGVLKPKGKVACNFESSITPRKIIFRLIFDAEIESE
jgi:hypothetical protein